MKIAFFDLEADGLLDTATICWCGVFKDMNTHEVFKFRPYQIQKMLRFMDAYDVLIAHNGIGYDFPLLKQLYGYTYKGKKVDTLIMSRLLNPKRQVPANCPDKKAGPHGIKSWGYRVGRGKPEHDDWENFSEEMLHRCSEDVEILELVYNELMKEAAGGNWKNAFLLSFKLFENLQKQEAFGWLVDRPHMDFCIKQLTTWIRRIDSVIVPKLPMILEVDELKKEGIYTYVRKPFLKSGKYSESVVKWCVSHAIDLDRCPVVGPYTRVSFRVTNLDSGQETKDYLLRSGWEPLEWNTNDDGGRTSPKLSKDDPFDGIEGKIGKLVAKRVQCRHRRSSIEGLIALIRPDGRIASIVNMLAVTGRATHRGIVNIPKAGSFFGNQMRKIFICPEGKVIVGTDSDACQIRMLAGRMNDPEYTENVINGDKDKGTDIHTVNMRAAGLPGRDAAKTFFYGFLFGAGDAKIGRIVGGTSVQGKQLKSQFLQGLPALGQLLQRLIDEWKKTARQKFNPQFNRMEFFNGKITALDGRPIVVPSEHQILVYLLQSDEAIMMTAAYNRFHQRMDKLGYTFGKEYGTVCWMHDEWSVECDKGIALVVKQEAEEAIAWAGRYFKIPCPHIGQGKQGTSWYAVH
jgi:DNA polymerase III epsilon subunit-like protein